MPECENGKFHRIRGSLAALPVGLPRGNNDAGGWVARVAPAHVVCVVINRPSTRLVVHRNDNVPSIHGRLLFVVIEHGTLGLRGIAGLGCARVHVPSVVGKTATLLEVKKPATVLRIHDFLSNRRVPGHARVRVLRYSIANKRSRYMKFTYHGSALTRLRYT